VLTTNQVVAEASALARQAATWNGDQAPPPDAIRREQIARLAGFAPSAGIAEALVSLGFTIVPIELPNLTASSPEIREDLGAVLEHYSRHPGDGVALRAGTQRNGSTLGALQFADAPTYAVWLREHAMTTETWRDDTGATQERHLPRPFGDPARTSWSPPPARPGTIAAFGLSALAQAHSSRLDPMRAAQREPVTVVWAIPAPSDGRHPTIRSRKLTQGVEVLGEGALLPWHVVRPSGWTLTATKQPVAPDQPLPDWLLQILTGKKAAAR
jgi:hypothetical protein